MTNSSTFPIPDSVLTDVRSAQPRDTLRQMARALELASGVDADILHTALMASENVGGSAIGDGVAVIGARVPAQACARRLSGFAVLSRPVMFRGVETHPCELVYVLISPEDEAQGHLRDLSSIIRAFRDRDFLDRIRAATTADKLTSLFRSRDTRSHAVAA